MIPAHTVQSPLPRALPVRGRGLRIGLMGGSFDPAHAGHLHCARVAMNRLKLHRIWWLVSPQNPLKAKSAPLAQRVASARAVIGRRPRMIVTTFESAFGLSYTVETLRFLRARAMGAQFIWVTGEDAMATLHHWRQWRMLVKLAPIAIAPRQHGGARASKAFEILRACRVAPGALLKKPPPRWTLLGGPRNSQSSTALRAALRTRP